MADKTTDRRPSVTDPYLAVLLTAAEARRLSDALRQIGGQRYRNPVTLAMERLQAGLLTGGPEDQTKADGAENREPPVAQEPGAGPPESIQPPRELLEIS